MSSAGQTVRVTPSVRSGYWDGLQSKLGKIKQSSLNPLLVRRGLRDCETQTKWKLGILDIVPRTMFTCFTDFYYINPVDVYNICIQVT